MSRAVYFVGTIGLDTARDVFDGVGERLAGHIRQVPDGEVAGRRQWVTYQLPVLRSYGFLKPVPPNRFVPLELSDAFDSAEVRFAELGYAREARASYADFLAARERGTILPGVRFQVGMPTPFAVLRAFTTVEAMPAIEEAYTDAMLRELAEIATHVPPGELAFQWDIAPEMGEWDAHTNAGGLVGPDGREGIVRRITRLSNAVPPEVSHGYHFCYGDFDASQVEKPAAPAAMIDLYHALSERVSRPINWVHMPIPAHADQAFFDGFKALRLRPETQLYLGLIYGPEDEEGARQRIAMAERVLAHFGIATRCGIARGRSAERVKDLLTLHAALA